MSEHCRHDMEPNTCAWCHRQPSDDGPWIKPLGNIRASTLSKWRQKCGCGQQVEVDDPIFLVGMNPGDDINEQWVCAGCADQR